MQVIIGDDGKESYRMDGSAKLSYHVEGTTPMATDPQANTVPTEKTTKPRGPRTFAGKSFALVYNRETEQYEMAFEGRNRAIRFESPVNASNLLNPLAGGMLHTSGRHKFKLSFHGDALSCIVNTTVDLPEGHEHVLVESVNVPFDSELAKWIRVLVEVDVVAAARIK